ncbi:hypothetical protein ACFE04_030971 [Oxalis oulophora]
MVTSRARKNGQVPETGEPAHVQILTAEWEKMKNDLAETLKNQKDESERTETEIPRQRRNPDDQGESSIGQTKRIYPSILMSLVEQVNKWGLVLVAYKEKESRIAWSNTIFIQVAQVKQQASILESYLEQRGIALPEGYLSYKVLEDCGNDVDSAVVNLRDHQSADNIPASVQDAAVNVQQAEATATVDVANDVNIPAMDYIPPSGADWLMLI